MENILPALLHDKMNGQSPPSQVRVVVTVVSPLNALIKDQIRRSSEGSLKAAALSVNKKRKLTDLELDIGNANFSRLKDASYNLVFIHPKAFLSYKEGMSLFQSTCTTYQHAVKAIVVDEAHCILEW